MSIDARPPRWLFLDFDGVLHAQSEHLTRPFHLARQLDDTLRGQACAVVVSSSWRHAYSLDHIRERLPRGLAARIVGCTGDALFGPQARFREIRAWLQAERLTQADWRALDDSVREFPPGCPHLIACSPNGLGARELRAISAWLVGG